MADKYDPIRLVGKGSFGSVYLVSRRRDGAQFVLKNMQINNLPDKEIESYQNEVALLTALEHPGIVSHIESFIDGDRQHMCIVMGYCEGGDLAAYLKHKKGIPMRDGEVLYHFVQMAMALLFMHDKKILHRDLKTANIFLKDGLIQLGDFGISKALTGSNDFASTCIGTPYYMSPELFQNKPYDYKSDVWALGCVLYEMMTYKHAFDATSINGLAQKILKGHIQQLPATYPKLMRTLVKDMLQLEPKSRPTIQQILSLPFLRKHIKTYVTAVLMNRAQYRAQDLVNFRAQIGKLGMSDMLEPPAPPPPPPSVPPLSLGQAPPASAPGSSSGAASEKASARASSRVAGDGGAGKLPPPSSSSSSAATVAAREKEREKAAVAAARHREQAARLQALQEEEAARKSLEEKLARLKKAHELKQKSLLEQQKRAARPGSALPSARGAPGSVVPSSKAKPLAPSASKSTLPKKPASSSSSSSSAAGAAAGSAAAKRPPSAGGVPSLPIASAHSVAAAGLPSQRGSVPPSSSPPQSSNGHGVESRSSSRSQLAEERARKLSRDRAEHEQALRLKEVEEMRAAEAARLAEVERIELRRRQLELVRRQKQESEAAALAAREKELERARADDLARQRRVYLAQVEAEKAELERIQLEKAWISKRLNDLAAAKPAQASAQARAPVSRARNLREDPDDGQGLSQKERILREKEARRAAQDAEEQAKLLQGRQEAFRDRLKVHNQSKGSLAPHLQSAMAPGSAPGPAPVSAQQLYRQDSADYADEDFDTDGGGGAGGNGGASSEDDEAVAEELAVEAEAIEEAEGLLLGLTRRIQDLRTSIQVPTVLEDAQDHDYGEGDFDEEDEDAACEDESESESEQEAVQMQQQKAAAAAATPVITQNMLDRMKALAKECAKLVGRAKFIDAFDYLKGAAANVTRDQKVAELTRILGPEKVKYWEKIDQLVFMEKSS